MVACILCLESTSSQTQRNIDIFSEEGLRLNIAYIISKHFWIHPRELSSPQRICLCCWETIRDFHLFYQRVAEAHNYLQEKTEHYAVVTEDPLPHEVILKSEEVSSAGQLVAALGDNFFDSEVKLEVHDLDMLPQIEIIDPVGLSERAQRASRRNRQSKENSAASSPYTAKRIKKEKSFNSSDDNSEHELPLAVLLKLGTKTDSKRDYIKLSAAIGENAEDTLRPLIEEKKKRPYRTKQNRDPAREQPDVEECLQPDKTIDVKAEPSLSGSDIDEAHELLAGGLNSEPENSESSRSGSYASKDSLSDAEPQELYAEIPKRVAKPKKYRKRRKPQVPPRRMTREEIDRKNAVQAEYDKVIAKFFEKFSCPKCSLLVQNFGEMKRHFRVSHNNYPGYMSCCDRKFHLRKALAEHVYVHWNPEHFKCSTCTKVFQHSRALEVHELTHTNPPESKKNKLFQCDKCPKHLSTKAAFEYHSISKHVPKSEFKFSCPECNKKLPTQRKLEAHMKYMHDPESAIICDKCGKQVRSQWNLKKHHQIEHSDIPRPAPVPMQCEICGTWLRHLAGLKQHMKTIHEDTGEHRCHICNKTSTNARALIRHIHHNHEYERKFKCTMCEKAFTQPQALREHASTHTGKPLYTCPNCPMTFSWRSNMYRHRQSVHRTEYEADRKRQWNLM